MTFLLSEPPREHDVVVFATYSKVRAYRVKTTYAEIFLDPAEDVHYHLTEALRLACNVCNTSQTTDQEKT